MNDVISAEIGRYLQWLTEFEAQALTRDFGLSRWYESEIVRLYTRSGTPGQLARGGSAIGLSNIEVATVYQGNGFFSSLIQTLADGAGGLPYARIEVESVNNVRLIEWLMRNGFQAYQPGIDAAQFGASFFKNRDAANNSPPR